MVLVCGAGDNPGELRMKRMNTNGVAVIIFLINKFNFERNPLKFNGKNAFPTWTLLLLPVVVDESHHQQTPAMIDISTTLFQNNTVINVGCTYDNLEKKKRKIHANLSVY